MSDMIDFIAKGYPFRLRSVTLGKYAFPRSHQASDQTRYVEAHPDPNDRATFYAQKEGDLFRIYSLIYNSSPEWMFVSGDKKGGDHIVEVGPDRYAQDNRGLFRIDDIGNGQVTIHNDQYDGRYVFASNDTDGGDNIVEAHPASTDTTKWSVEFVDATYELSNLNYDTSNMTHMDQPPLDMGSQESKNDLSIVQNPTLIFKKTASVSRTFTSSVGMKEGWTTKITGTVPGFGGVEDDFSMEIDTTFSWGTTAQDSQEVDVSFPVNVPPYTTVKATAVFSQAKVTVPYTADVKATFNDSQKSVLRYSISGTYSGINAYDLKTDYEPVSS